MSGNPATLPAPARITSVDSLRGFVMFVMIFVNDLANAPENIVPDWMVHFSDRHKEGSGMTFVDLVFPAFLFIVGMSIPFALGSRLSKGDPVWKISGHIVMRTLALLALGILMVNGESGGGAQWHVMMFLSGIFAFCVVSPRNTRPDAGKFWKVFSLCLRVPGFAGMLYCALSFTDKRGQHILTLNPLHLHTSWYGILGLIGWAYLAAAVLFLIFRTHRTALLGCVGLMTAFFGANKEGFFDNFWPAHFVDFGGTLGSQAAIAVAGLLLSTILVTQETAAVKCRVKFTLLFIAGFAFAAVLLTPVYGISKDDATPAWCLWSSAITAALWLGFYFFCDVKPVKFIAKPLSIAGQNVLLAYLISEMQESVLKLLHLGDWYDSLSEGTLSAAIARSVVCAVIILVLTAGLNRIGFRLKL
jgi:predicted acyltransferase